MEVTYKDSGVDIEKGEEAVKRIKSIVRNTFSLKVVSDIGGFGGLYDVSFLKDFERPILVSSVDGVGTKLKVAFMNNQFSTVGEDLVNHCVNDIAVCGAVPLYFMDYFATGKLNPDVMVSVVEGFSKACIENNCSLIGGETAEMPSMYQDGEFDLAGMIVGVVEHSKMKTGSNSKAGNLLIGLPSTGLHTNGYSLARKVLFPKYSIDDRLPGKDLVIGEALLKVHKSYLNTIQSIIDIDGVNAFSHITGGGIEGNTLRVIPKEAKLAIDWNSWERPEIFNLIQREGNVPEKDMRSALNLGVGLVIIIEENSFDVVFNKLKLIGESPFLLGKLTCLN